MSIIPGMFDIEKTKKKLEEQEGDRTRVSVYVSKSVWQKFQKACKPQSASQVLEDWMKEALERKKQ